MKILMSQAILRPMEESEHYGLFRAILLERRDPRTGKIGKEETGEEIGPLMVFRVARSDESVDTRTIEPGTQRELRLHKVWDARGDR